MIPAHLRHLQALPNEALLALAARWGWLGLFFLGLFDFFFVSVVTFGHNE